MATGRVSSLLFLVAGLLIVGFTITRRQATRLEASWHGRVVALIGTFAPSALRPADLQVLPDYVLGACILLGAVLAVYSIIFLGRNIGIIAAHRGITVRGPYRVIRHPLYASYLIMHAGYVGANVSVWNVCVWILAEAAQMARTLYEERVLTTDHAYRDYQQRVRWRIIPGVF
jgi:protein-S-isoprenylcysteine O-methyltransferase Ste14